jgi:hypothetical protein
MKEGVRAVNYSSPFFSVGPFLRGTLEIEVTIQAKKSERVSIVGASRRFPPLGARNYMAGQKPAKASTHMMRHITLSLILSLLGVMP